MVKASALKVGQALRTKGGLTILRVPSMFLAKKSNGEYAHYKTEHFENLAGTLVFDLPAAPAKMNLHPDALLTGDDVDAAPAVKAARKK